MVRRSVQQKTAREISEHKTDAVFSRYNIMSGADIEDAARKIEEGARAAVQGSIHRSLIVEPKPDEKKNKAFLITVPEWRNWQTQQTQNLPELSFVWVRLPPPGPLFFLSLHVTRSPVFLAAQCFLTSPKPFIISLNRIAFILRSISKLLLPSDEHPG